MPSRIWLMAILALTTAPAHADTTDDLILALINKGVLTEEEGEPLLKKHSLMQAKANNQGKEKTNNNDVTILYADGFSMSTADQANIVAINGRVEFDSRHYGQRDEQNIDTFDIRRANLTLKGKLQKYYDFNITADFGQQNNPLGQAYFGINWVNQAKLRLGQFDMPFGMEHLTSDLFVEFQERSFIDALTPGKERGVMLHGAPVKGVYYGIAASSGRGLNVNNQDGEVDHPDIIARVSTNLAEVFGNNDAVYHLGVDYSTGDISPNQARGSSQLTAGGFTAVSVTTEGRGIKFFTPGKFSTTLTNNPIERTRYGLEGAYASGPFKVQSEGFKHNYAGVNDTNTAFNKDLSAWYVAGVWMLTGENLAATYQANGTWGRVTPRHDFSPTEFGAGSIGAWGIALRYSEFNASDFDIGSGPGEIVAGSSTTRAQAWTTGVRWLLTSHAHLVANYVTTHFDQPIDVKNSAGTKIASTNRENAITLRAQIDF